jgi:DNA-directed RNA polymerase subunit K/omega
LKIKTERKTIKIFRMFEEEDFNEEDESLIESFFIPEILKQKPEQKQPVVEELEDFRLTRYEYSKVISKRVEQLAKGSSTELKGKLERMSLQEIAKKELEEGLVPLKILREFPSKRKIQILKLYGKKIREEDIV